MSDATSVATAIPREINLGLQKPVATPAYTRRFKSNASNPVVTAGSQVTITLDTAQPGSFIDTLSSYLSFKLDLINPSTTSGYNVSFSSAGAHALFRAMRIYVQGVPIEEITEYNALAEWLHDMAGIPDYCDRSAKGKYFSNTMMSDQTIYLPPATTSGAQTVFTRRSMNIQLPLLSGVLGTMADKMFPSMLVAPGNCYIQLDLSQAAHALRIVEIDLTNLVVGTAPITGNDARFTDVSLVAAPAQYNSVSDTFLLPGEAICNPSASIILDVGPYDAPFAIGASGVQGSGVLSTEERLGGGMYYAGTGEYASATNTLRVSNTIGDTAAAGLAINSISNTADATNSNAIFLGSGMDYTGGGAAGRNTQRCTPSGSILVTYEVRDLEFVGKQVVVGDDVARAIIERAAAGDISIHTQSYRQYPATIPLNGRWAYEIDEAYNQVGVTSIPLRNGMPLTNMTTRYNTPGGQSIIVPAKISSANAIYFTFRNSAAENDFRFDSLRRMTIGMTDNAGSAGPQAQLRIGNELIPQSPIASASEAMEELLKAHHMGGYYGTCEKFGSIVASASQYVWPSPASYMLRRALGTNTPAAADIPIGRRTGMDTNAAAASQFGGVVYARNDFNSQILSVPGHSVSIKYPVFGAYAVAGGLDFKAALSTGAAPNFYSASPYAVQNYNLTRLTTSVGVTAVTPFAESQEDYANRQRRWKDAVRAALFGYADERSDHQVTDPTKPNFMNPYKQHAGRYSTFMLGFDLDTFSHNTDVVRSGHYLGNNTVSLNLSNMKIVDNSPLNMPLCNSVRMDTFVLHDLRLSFQAGGIVQAFY
jgi:hypothetical protein